MDFIPIEHRGINKYRCIARAFIDSDPVEMAIRTIAKASGEETSELSRHLRGFAASEFLARRPRHTGRTERQAVADSIAWTFSRRAGEIDPQRFNTSEFGALYTSAQRDTAKTERQFYALKSPRVSEFPFCVISVRTYGRFADLRAWEANGSWSMPEEHAPCREIASAARKEGYQGVAAPSARARPDGTCCAIFDAGAVRPGRVVERGIFYGAAASP